MTGELRPLPVPRLSGPEWYATVERVGAWGPTAWYGQVHHDGSTLGGTFGWTEGSCERRVLRRMRRAKTAAHRRAATMRTIRG